MISNYIRSPWRIAQMQATCVGPYLDDFSAMLAEAGYSRFTIRGYVRAADHIGQWADRRGAALPSWNDKILVRFGRHLGRCKCSKTNKGVFGDAIAGVRLLIGRAQCLSAARTRGPITSDNVHLSLVLDSVHFERFGWILGF